MPEISRFFKIIIKMFYKDHAPPLFHAFYGNYKATFSIRTGEMIDGKFPPKQISFVKAWALIHEKELMLNWNALIKGNEATKIEPLR